MTPSREQMIDAVSAAYANADLTGLESYVTEDCVYDWSRSIGPMRGVYAGPEGRKRLFDEYMEPWDDVDWRVLEVVELDGDRVLVVTSVRGRGRGSGIDIDASGTQLWEFRDDLISRVTLFQDKESALAELGEAAR